MIWLQVQLNSRVIYFSVRPSDFAINSLMQVIFRSCPSQLNKQFRPGYIWGLVTARQWEVCVYVCEREKAVPLSVPDQMKFCAVFFFFLTGFTNTNSLLAASSGCHLAVSRKRGQVFLSFYQIQAICEPCLTCELNTWAHKIEFKLKIKTGLGCCVSRDCTIYALCRCSHSKMTSETVFRNSFWNYRERQGALRGIQSCASFLVYVIMMDLWTNECWI